MDVKVKPADDGMLIGELARRTGVSRRSLRYYEQQGLVHARRNDRGWRRYGAPAEHRVRAVARMIADGLTVEQIKAIEPCLDLHDSTECDDPDGVVETYRSRLAVLDGRLEELRRQRERLAEVLGRLES